MIKIKTDKRTILVNEALLAIAAIPATGTVGLYWTCEWPVKAPALTSEELRLLIDRLMEDSND